MGWLLHPLSGQGYQFWSGIGSDFGELTLLGGVVMVFRAHNCHSKGCPRLGKHPYRHYRYCKYHHPVEKKKWNS